MDQKGTRCNNLIEATAGALNGDIITLMLLAVQKNNLGLGVNLALKRSVHQFKETIGRDLIKLCRIYSSASVKKVGVPVRSSCSGAARTCQNAYFFYRCGRFDTKTIVRECLFRFPYLWASVQLVFIVTHDGQCAHNDSW